MNWPELSLGGDFLRITLHLAGAVAAGGLIGLERSIHGRPAGFRTHALVALASSVLMVVPMYQVLWVPAFAQETFRTDPTRMAQGIMTGIGFLGAGVIIKDGYTVKGLTTAASIWVTAAIGILVGSDFYAAAISAVVLTLTTLTVLRLLESRIPRRRYVHFFVKFPRDQVMPEEDLKALVAKGQYKIEDVSYELNGGGDTFEYHVVMWSKKRKAPAELIDALSNVPEVLEMKLLPSKD